MKRKTVITIFKLVIPLALAAVLLLFGSFYAYWNRESPEKTCASCHEIAKSVELFAQSAHREMKCSECHGTAMSNGLHSLKEKGMMVVSHMRSDAGEDIRLNQVQLLAVMDNCTRCHSSEYADWKSGGHSALYHDIFLDSRHNETEQINADCLRCHGMFSDVPVSGVVEPLSRTGPWKLKDPSLADKPVIPCMACHQAHRSGIPRVSPDYSAPSAIFYNRRDSNVVISLYYRPDKRSISADDLPKLRLHDDERDIRVSDDIAMKLCIQCHAPGSRHQAGTGDDRTPRGVHEGLSCTACHALHSNDARQSCSNCHPAISNCGLDVTKMNTSFKDRNSANNIHWVACTDCHREKGFRRKMKTVD